MTSTVFEESLARDTDTHTDRHTNTHRYTDTHTHTDTHGLGSTFKFAFANNPENGQNQSQIKNTILLTP